MWIISSLQDDMQMNIFSAGEALASLSLWLIVMLAWAGVSHAGRRRLCVTNNRFLNIIHHFHLTFTAFCVQIHTNGVIHEPNLSLPSEFFLIWMMFFFCFFYKYIYSGVRLSTLGQISIFSINRLSYRILPYQWPLLNSKRGNWKLEGPSDISRSWFVMVH